MNIINRCITIRNSISRLNNNTFTINTTLPVSTKFIVSNNKSNKYFSTTNKDNEKTSTESSTESSSTESTESELTEKENENEQEQEQEYDQLTELDEDMNISASNLVLEKNIKEISKKMSEFYTPTTEKIKLHSIPSKNVTPLMKCIHLNNQANELILNGKFDEAETILISGISLYERSEVDQQMSLHQTEMGITTHQVHGYLLSNIAYVYHSKGLFVDAIKYYTKSLGFLETQEDKPFYGNTLLNLSEIFSLLQDNLKAIETCKLSIKVLEDFKDYIIDDRFGLALLNLSSYLSVEGKYEEALPYCKRSFTLLEKSLGRNNELVQSAATNLSKLYSKLNMNEDANQLDALFVNPLESSLQYKFDIKKDLSHIDFSKLKQQWSQQGHQRVFDIQGFYKSSTTAKKQYSSFLRQLEEQGIKYGPETSSILKPELESTSYSPDVINQWKPLTISLKDGQIERN